MTDYYVDNVGGSDSSPNDGLSEGNAWATIQKGVDALAAGDILYIKGGTIYTETAVTTSTLAAFGNPIQMIGYTTTPGDNGKVTITPTTGKAFTHTGGTMYWIVMNIRFNNSLRGWDTAVGDNVTFVNCEFSGNSQNGCFADNSMCFVNCESINNGTVCIDVDSTAVFIGCIVGNPGSSSNAANGNSGARIHRCLFYGIQGNFTKLLNDTACGTITNCTFDADNVSNSSCMITTGTQAYMIVDNIFYDAGAYGVEFNGTAEPRAGGFIGYNLVNSNGTADYELTTGLGQSMGFGDVTDAPEFKDEAGDDYSIRSSSPAINAGLKPGVLT